MRLLFLFLILLGSVHHSIADHFTDKKTKTDANLTGHVINKNTGEHIPFFTVSLKGTTLGTATDETGHYFLKNLPVGSYTIRVNGVGYRSAEKQIVLRQGETRELNFEVEEDIIQLETVVISANKNETKPDGSAGSCPCDDSETIRKYQLGMSGPGPQFSTWP